MKNPLKSVGLTVTFRRRRIGRLFRLTINMSESISAVLNVMSFARASAFRLHPPCVRPVAPNHFFERFKVMARTLLLR